MSATSSARGSSPWISPARAGAAAASTVPAATAPAPAPLEDAAVAEALAGLYRYCEKVRYLGSWPQEGWVGGVSGPSGSVPPDYSDSRRWIRDLRRGRLRRGGHLDPEAGSERNRTV